MSKLPYTPTESTLKISGSTDCRKAAQCAAHYLVDKKVPVDFMFIGANAGNQAVKAISILKNMLSGSTSGVSSVLIDPLHVSTVVDDTSGKTEMDAVVLRVLVIRDDMYSKLKAQNGVS